MAWRSRSIEREACWRIRLLTGSYCLKSYQPFSSIRRLFNAGSVEPVQFSDINSINFTPWSYLPLANWSVRPILIWHSPGAARLQTSCLKYSNLKLQNWSMSYLLCDNGRSLVNKAIKRFFAFVSHSRLIQNYWIRSIEALSNWESRTLAKRITVVTVNQNCLKFWIVSYFQWVDRFSLTAYQLPPDGWDELDGRILSTSLIINGLWGHRWRDS